MGPNPTISFVPCVAVATAGDRVYSQLPQSSLEGREDNTGTGHRRQSEKMSQMRDAVLRTSPHPQPASHPAVDLVRP